MSAISAATVKDLREKTGAGMMDCKKALQESDGDIDKAVDILRTKCMAAAEKRSARATKEGLVHAYIHANGKIGVLIEVNCETDFVAKTEDFQVLCKDLAMQVAAASPRWVKREEVPGDVLDRERSIYKEQMKDSGKPEKVLDKIIEGKLRKFYEGACLLDQPFIRDDKQSVAELIKSVIAKTGENISVNRFARFQLGQEA